MIELAKIEPPGGRAHPEIAAAGFTASRRALLDDEAIPGSAETARSVCRTASATVSIFALAGGRTRRIDVWHNDIGLVAHPTGRSTSQPVRGVVTDVRHAVRLLDAVGAELVGGLPNDPATTTVEVADLSDIDAAALPAPLTALVVAVVHGRTRGTAPAGLVVGDVGGLVAGSTARPGSGVHLRPVDPAGRRSLLAGLLGSHRSSVADLLAD